MDGSLAKGSPGTTAMMKEPIAAIVVAFQAGIFKIAKAMMSHRIGKRARNVVSKSIVETFQ